MPKLAVLEDRTVPPEWAARLADLSPPTNKSSYLHLLWEPGYPWEPVERWMIYQMIPRHGIPNDLLEQLEDYPPPSQMGNYYDHHLQNEDGTVGGFVRNPDCLITERAYWLYKKTRCWGRPYWVVQGPDGGHKRWFTPVEQKLLRLAGLPPAAPAPGDLPYAEFSERTMDRLAELDLLKATNGALRRKKGLLKGLYSSSVEAEERAFREKLVKWLVEQVTMVDGERVTNALMKLDAPRADIDPKEIERQSEQAEANFVEYGNSYKGILLK